MIGQIDPSGVTLSLESVVAVGVGIALKFVFDTWLPRKQEHEQGLVSQMSGQINTLLSSLMEIVQEKLSDVSKNSERSIETAESARATTEAMSSVVRTTDRKVDQIIQRLDRLEGKEQTPVLPPKPVPRPRD